LADVREELCQISLLVNELLSFSKSSLGQAVKAPETVLLLTLLDEVAGMESIPAHCLRLSLPRDLSVKAVPDLLRRVVSNILRNARLHAPDSNIEITASRKGDRVVLTIADQGPGVPTESLPRLFDPFYRVDTSRDRQTGGTGLGLAIVKTCMDTCGGTVTVNNREPHGLIFELELPRA
jgi:two-component system sensor histidine kinase CpxA